MHARQLTYFLAVVDHRGFGRAAAVLKIAQPTLSQSVKSLERELGAELFHRASPGVVLTAAGRALLGPARQLVRDVAAARDSVGDATAAGVVDLVAAAPLGVYPGVELVAAYHREHPDILVRLDRADTTDELSRMVRDGTSELGLTYLPAARLGLAETPLGAHELHLMFAADQAPPPGPVALADLSRFNLIGLPRGTPQRDLVESVLRAAGVRTRLTFELAQRDAILDLVAAGSGVAFVVDAGQAAAHARGVTVRPVDPPVRQRYGLVHRAGALSEPARAFLAMAAAHAGTGAGSGEQAGA